MLNIHNKIQNRKLFWKNMFRTILKSKKFYLTYFKMNSPVLNKMGLFCMPLQLRRLKRVSRLNEFLTWTNFSPWARCLKNWREKGEDPPSLPICPTKEDVGFGGSHPEEKNLLLPKSFGEASSSPSSSGQRAGWSDVEDWKQEQIWFFNKFSNFYFPI